MNSNLTWKVITIAAVIGLSVLAFYPPEKKVRLGLDLKGGVHLVVSAEVTVERGHEVAHAVEAELRVRFPQVSDVVIHVEPLEAGAPADGPSS